LNRSSLAGFQVIADIDTRADLVEHCFAHFVECYERRLKTAAPGGMPKVG